MTNLLVACGEKAPTNATIDGTQVEQTPESITPEVEPTTEPQDTIAPDDGNDESGVVESGTLDDVPDGNETNDILGDYESVGTRTVFTSLFPKGSTAEAWNEEHRFTNFQDYSYYITYFKNGNGDEMSFTWVAKSGIGALAALSDDERFFYLYDESGENQSLVMWNYGTMSNESELMKNIGDIDTILSWSNGTPIEGSFQVEDTNDFYRVTFKTNETINGKSFVSFNCYIDYPDIMECWQFKYLVEESLFNEAEALAVVNSIERVNLDDLGIIVQE